VLTFLFGRIVQSAFIIFLMSVLVFCAVNIVGNPVDILISQNCTGSCREQVIQGLGLDRPILEQYFVFAENVLKGDFGRSFALGVPAGELILERLPATLELAFVAILIAIVVGIPLGLWAGIHPETLGGKLILGGSILGFSLPTFWVGLLLIMVFGVHLGWLPPTGRGPTQSVLGVELSVLTIQGWRHILLPAVTLALFKTALVIRLTRAGAREVMLLDYIKFARAKGISRARVVLVHVLRNVLIPVITVLGLETGNVIAFSVVTETIFAWPGIGKLLIDSIQVLDRPVMVSYLMLTVTLFVVINLVVDLLYSMLDPRVRFAKTTA
jgi:peptide/nickel transport system permease protein